VDTQPICIKFDATGVSNPIIFSPQLLELHQLKHIFIWHMVPDRLKWQLDNASDLQEGWQQIMPQALEDLIKGRESRFRPEQVETRQALLAHLQEDGLVHGPPWSLTDKGIARTSIGQFLREPSKLLKRALEGTSYSSMTSYELLLELQLRGWEHRLARKRESADLAPFAKGGVKIWYQLVGHDTISRHYFVALLTADSDDLPQPLIVPHLLIDGAYIRLLGGHKEKHTYLSPPPKTSRGAS